MCSPSSSHPTLAYTGEIRCRTRPLRSGMPSVPCSAVLMRPRFLRAAAQGTTSVSFSRYRHISRNLVPGRRLALEEEDKKSYEKAKTYFGKFNLL